MDAKDEAVQMAVEVLDELAPRAEPRRPVTVVGPVGVARGTRETFPAEVVAPIHGGDDAASSAQAGGGVIAVLPSEMVTIPGAIPVPA